MQKRRVSVLVTAACVLVSASVARASFNASCTQQVRDQQTQCRNDCRDAAQEGRDLCRNIDPSCGNACRAGRASCVAPYLVILQACLDDCSAQLAAAKAKCPPFGDPGRDACVDAAQVTAFMCRDACQEDPTVRAGIATCRKANRACLKACPPPPAQ